MTILDKIIERSKIDLEEEKLSVPLTEMIARAEQTGSTCRDFFAAFDHPEEIKIIAELKKASPSKGLIRDKFDPVELCLDLQGNGAAALSVLTEKNFFRGSMEYLLEVAKLVNIPVLRKDFIYDPYQIYQARAARADAILLIAAALEKNHFRELYELASELGLHVLCEVHNHQELDMVMDIDVKIIGINSRDLKTFKTDLNITMDMLRLIPDGKVRIAESGINTPADIQRMLAGGASGFLVGESLMREQHPGAKLAELIDGALQ
jgi:indole-3-glycerol phosphate synthase